MRCAGLLVFLAVSTLLARAQAPAPAARSDPPAPPDVSEVNTVVFGHGGDHELHARIAWPMNATRPLPAVLYIHGGGWRSGDYAQGPVRQIAQHGYFAASIEYRLSPVAKWPAQIEDCKCAVRWLRANAATYHVDPERIAAWGDSAGGQLVSCLGTMAGQKQYEGDGGWPGVSSAVQAVIDFYGPEDMTRPDIYTPFAIQCSEGLFGCTFAQNPALWKSGSPLFYVKRGDPPFLIVQGDSDTIVPMAQSQILADALEKAGVPHQLVIVKNADHGFRPVDGKAIDPSREQISQDVFAFLGKYLQAP